MRRRIRALPLGVLGMLGVVAGCGGNGSFTDGSSGSGGAGGANPAGSGGRPTSAGAPGMGGKSSGASGSTSGAAGSAAGAPQSGGSGGQSGSAGGTSFPPNPDDLPPAGNPDGKCAVPAGAGLENTSSPDFVIGTGTPASCTGEAFVAAVAKGGVITFDCGPDPVTITLARTAKVRNDAAPRVVIDGGGKVTLSGGGEVRILYQNTCDQAQTWTTPTCQDQDHPALTIQNLTFVDGNAKGESWNGEQPDGGGAVFAYGGRLKIVNSRFFGNVCDDTGQDVGGAAVRAGGQHRSQPLYVVNSTFGGAEGLGNVCSNGGGLSSIGVSYTVVNSLFSHNQAIGNGANPARAGTPGGGSGGAIYNDGNLFTLSLCGTRITDNTANEGGGAIFFVSNDRSGSLRIQDSVFGNNPSDGFETEGFPGIFVLANGDPEVTNSVLQ